MQQDQDQGGKNRPVRADLHIHTIYSDGAYTPAEIVARAAAAGVEFLSMTDHDSMEGMDEKRAAAEAAGLGFVSGWEVSAYAGAAKVHVLGYGCRRNAAYEEFLEKRRQGAVLRAEDMIQKANACFGLRLTLDDAERLHLKKSAPLHTMHVVSAYAAKLGRKKGELYLEYFSTGGRCYSDLMRPTPQDAIDVIHATGGIASLAHPGRIPLAFSERERLMDALVAYGLDGIEYMHSDHTDEDRAYFRGYGERNGLYLTGGSDFHAEGARNRFLGLPPFFPDARLTETFARLRESE